MTASLLEAGKPVSQVELQPHRRHFRADIQGLRAVAVAIVVLYHLWPNRLPGGFVGVDVFFVISGFLITSHLLARPPRSARDLAAFWGRRVRRLLPASLLVLAVTLVATRLVAPDTQWAGTARDVIAAALYVENWRLASTSVDYLLAEAAASPVQHFWSLSVEEQFYFVWPVLILLVALVAARRGLRMVPVCTAALVVVVLGSLAYSVHITAVEPAAAYFVTPARIWELGAGGLLALTGSLGGAWLRSGARRAALAWAGYGMIAVAALSYSSATPFPGSAALLPVAGAVAVIAASADGERYGPGIVVERRPIQILGNVSYSVYLWHWPLIVLLPHVSGGRLGLVDKVAVLIGSLVLAGLTKRYVEDRYLVLRPAVSLRRTFVLAAAGMAAVLSLGFLQLAEVEARESDARGELAAAASGGDPCFGAAAMAPGADCAGTDDGDMVPAPALAPQDKSAAYEKACFVEAPFTDLRTCVFGDPSADVSIALVGNSHAGHWLPAIEPIAKQRGWKITTFLASECTISATAVQWDAEDKQAGCLDRARQVMDQTINGDFDLVIASERNGRPAVGRTRQDSWADWLRGYQDRVTAWSAADVPVLVLHDTATPGATVESVPDCVAANLADLAACSGPRERWVPRDPLVQAAKDIGDPDITTVDLNDFLCDERTCPAVIGGVLAYYDGSHMTATFARSLAPYLDPSVTEALARSEDG